MQLRVGEATHIGLWSQATQTLLHGHPDLPLSQPVLLWSLSLRVATYKALENTVCLKR